MIFKVSFNKIILWFYDSIKFRVLLTAEKTFHQEMVSSWAQKCRGCMNELPSQACQGASLPKQQAKCKWTSVCMSLRALEFAFLQTQLTELCTFLPGDQKQVMHMSRTSTPCKQGDFQIYLNWSNPRISWTSLPCISVTSSSCRIQGQTWLYAMR